MSTAGPGPESVGPLPLSLGRPAPTSVPVPDWRERRGAKGRPTQLGIGKAAIFKGGKDLGGHLSPGAPSPCRRTLPGRTPDTRPLLLTSKRSATASMLPYSALTHVLSFRMGDSVPLLLPSTQPSTSRLSTSDPRLRSLSPLHREVHSMGNFPAVAGWMAV